MAGPVIAIVLPLLLHASTGSSFSIDASSLDQAPIYYQRPSVARLAALQPLSNPGCSYQGTKYNHADQVITPEPCLNCTCKRGVLLCFLKVCPALLHHSGGHSCHTVREAGQCCPVMKCDSLPMTTVEDWGPTVTTITTASAYHDKQRIGLHVNDLQDERTNHTETVIKPHSSSSVRLSPEALQHATTPGFASHPSSESSINGLEEKADNAKVTVTANAVYFQTSPATSIQDQDSPRVVTSSPTNEAARGEGLDPETLEGGCHLNGSLYAEGSAVMSSAFCEYCYCIRGKKMCIRPRCHLSIMDCLPRYSSEYACCPTSYSCGTSAVLAESGNNWTNNAVVTPVAEVSKDGPMVEAIGTAAKNTLTSSTTTTTTSSTTTSTPTPSSTSASTTIRSCKEKGKFYRLGEQMSSNRSCNNCYCSYGGVKKCKKIQCSPVMQGCTPITPEGHCCPVEYKCNNNKNSRPRLEDDAEVSTSFTELPTTTVEDAALSTDEIESLPLPKLDAIKSTPVKQRPTESLAADIGGDVELGIDEPTTLAPTTNTTRAANHQLLLSVPSANDKGSPAEITATHFLPSESGDAKLGSGPVFVHVPTKSLAEGHESGVTTEASLTHAPLAQPENTVTAERREESVIDPKTDTQSLPTDAAGKTDLTPPVKDPITSDGKTTMDGTSNRTNGVTEIDRDLKIQPNQLYANWGNNVRNVSKQTTQTEEGHPVGALLDAIISTMDHRINQELPSEPRDTLVGKIKITDEQVAPPSAVPVKQPTSRREDENHEPAQTEPQNLSSSLLVKENRKDDDEHSFQLPPIPTGYISNLNPPTTEYQVHRNQHQQSNYHNSHSGNKNSNNFLASSLSQRNSTSGSAVKPAQAYGNTVGRIQVSSKIGFSMTPDHSGLLNIPHLPRPQTHTSNSGSFLVVGEDNDVKKAGTVEDDTLGTHVEIITAKTPFLEANVSNSNSFLINLSPTTLHVSPQVPSLYAPSEPGYESEKRGTVFSESPPPPLKPMPSFPSFPFATANNQWKIVTHNHSPKSKLPKSDDPSPADAYSPIGPELTRRSGFVMETSAEKRNEDESYGEASELPPAVAYEPSKAMLSNDALGQENPTLLAESSHAIIRSPMSPFLKRNGNIAVRGPITGTEEHQSAAMAASSVQRTGVSPASHDAPASLTATPASNALKPVFHEAQVLQPEASALKLTDAESAGDTTSPSERDRDAHEAKALERSATDFSTHPLFSRFPAVPSNVHSLQQQRPAFPFDPTASALPDHSFPVAPQNMAAPFSMSGISRSDQVFAHSGRQPPPTDAITPLIPQKPGTFFRTPINQFIPPNRSGPHTSGVYNRVPQNKVTAPWNLSQMPGRRGPPPHQMIGPMPGPRNPPHSLSPSQPHKKITLPAKFHFLNPYSLSEQQLPQHSQLVPSVVAPPDTVVSHSPAADASHPSGMMAESYVSNPSKIYTIPTIVKVDPIQTDAPLVPSSTPTAFPVMHHSEKAVEKDVKNTAAVQIESSTRSVLEAVMNAGTGWDANEVTPGVASAGTSTTTLAPVPMPTTPFSKPIWKLSTKKQLIFSASTPSASPPLPTTTTAAPTTTESAERGSNPWDLIRVSGCNIYGTFYQVDQSIGELSSACKKCFCSSFGVQCSKVC